MHPHLLLGNKAKKIDLLEEIRQIYEIFFSSKNNCGATRKIKGLLKYATIRTVRFLQDLSLISNLIRTCDKICHA
jgi:hypothetical protein